MKIGYACINETLSCQKPKVTTNRGMIKKTFQSKGKEYASSLALKNVIDLRSSFSETSSSIMHKCIVNVPILIT